MAAAVALSTLALGLAGCAEPPPPASPSGSSTTPALSEPAKVSGTGTAPVGANDPLDVEGSITVPAADTSVPSGTKGCKPAKDYEDVGAGAKVEVSDPSGKVLLTGALDEGEFDGEACSFSFSMSDLPGNFDHYGIQVAERGVVDYTREEVDENVLEMSLTDE